MHRLVGCDDEAKKANKSNFDLFSKRAVKAWDALEKLQKQLDKEKDDSKRKEIKDRMKLVIKQSFRDI
ncbi:hypothetical protein AGMMS49938_18240 [Fibrobacterales bacterium]|nr:hypothetical protein AGMMS49938_18240 [Fibrobacterales bacterium]